MRVSKAEKAIGKIGEITKYIPAADIFRFFNNLVDAYKEQQVTKREIARIEAGRDVMLAEIRSRYELYKMVFDRLFEERRSVIDQSFEIIDRGINSGDNQVILAGLEGLSRVVSTSPFANIDNLSRLLESGKQLEI